MAYSTISKPSDYFNTKIYTGNGSTNAITGVGFQPDMVWTKNRSAAQNHLLYDAVRGVGYYLYPNLSNAQGGNGTSGLTAFGTDGFTLDGGDDSNVNGQNGVAWSWKANGAGSSNTDGSINSTVSANTTAGFSIVSYTGTGNDPETIGHGLGVVPKMIIVKDRSTSGGWRVYNENIGNNKVLALDGTIASTTSDAWNSTTPTSSLFTVGNDTITNGNGTTHIAYCFAEKKGYSKFGSYTGNGSTDGTFIYTGFKPALVILKDSTSVSNWMIYDNKREGYNVDNDHLKVNNSDAEGTSDDLDILSNGFKLRTSGNGENKANATFIYMAIAEEPLVANVSSSIPATAR
nr:hypothetical protein [uncultured Mediterranean phage uvMED]